jgi:D-inositol-3-phosphate glycosyltransferase
VRTEVQREPVRDVRDLRTKQRSENGANQGRDGHLTTAVSLLTGGVDKPYASALAKELISRGVALDFVGSDELDLPEFRSMPGMKFLNLRGDQGANASLGHKVARICKYYTKLILYAASADPRIFHILWNNKFEMFDRTLLMLYYKFLRKKVVLTAHNVNIGRRDSKGGLLDRLTLRVQYALADHMFVHTEKMKRELSEEFAVHSSRVTVIPFGLNNEVPTTSLTAAEAKQRLGIKPGERTILFFGKIRPYKGLELLVSAFLQLPMQAENYRLVIAGKPGQGCEKYWEAIQEKITKHSRILVHAQFISDSDIEVYFKAADLVVLPYRHVYGSGILSLAYGFGSPVLAADVGSLKEEIIVGETGFAFDADDSNDLARLIQLYFASDLYRHLDDKRHEIRAYAAQRYSWSVVGHITASVYSQLLGSHPPGDVTAEQRRCASETTS